MGAISGMVTAEAVQDYVEGRLDQENGVPVEHELDNAAAAFRAQTLRRQASRLRELGARILSEPIPAKLLDILQRLTAGA
ncbi:MAG TPA: hypothetical protein VGB82_03975 [Alphaproteobacteria bacterium]